MTIAHLQRVVQLSNVPGNLDGLLAHYILEEDRPNFSWNVDPMVPQWLSDNKERLSEASGLAVIGYGLARSDRRDPGVGRGLLVNGLPRLMLKDPFPVDGVSFVNDASQVVGLALAVIAVQGDLPEARAWLTDVLSDDRLRRSTQLLGVFHQHARHLVAAPKSSYGDLRALDDPADLAGTYWLALTDKYGEPTKHDDLRDAGARILRSLILEKTEPSSAHRAALLLRVATHIVAVGVDQALSSQSHVGILLSRFEGAMRQWRYDPDTREHPIRWEITSEREVQNIVWLMLRPVFDDLTDEETLRKLGHSTYRADFAIPSLGLLIEVKYARRAADFKVFEREIMQDCIGYLTDNPPYRNLTVFIYDESASVQEHETTRNALMKIPGIADVVIVSRPSQIPAPDRR